MSQFEQQENVKSCQKLGKTASETFHMIKQAYGETLGRSAVLKWHKGFACPRGAAKTTSHRFATPSMLT
jgi:intein-encoded DNA endonuclease-like protein